MPLSITDVSFHASLASGGGTSSLGGQIGAVVTSQVATQPSVVTGAYVASAVGNPVGFGTLSYNPATQKLGWQAPGSSTIWWSDALAANTTVLVGSAAEGTLTVVVTFASLPSTYKAESLTISSPVGLVFSPVTTTMALIGDVQYRCTYFKNNHASLTATDVRLYVHAPPLAPQTLAVGVDPAGVGDGLVSGVAVAIATADVAPAGVVFSSPLLAADGLLLGTIPPGACVAFWQRRTVPPMAYGPLSIVSATIGVALVG